MVWGQEVARQSRDIDLLGRTQMAAERVGDVFRMLCDLEVEPDGLRFDRESVDVREIRDQAEYGGVRVRLLAYLGNARTQLQVDVGFGDVVSPEPLEAEYPTLLDFPAPVLRIYPKETVVAEKFEAIIRLGVTNTRLKDFFDLWALSGAVEFDGSVLTTAVRATLGRRQTPVPRDVPPALEPAYAESTEPAWRAFCRRIDVDDAPTFAEVTRGIRVFVLPVCEALVGETSPGTWTPADGWR